MRIAVTDANIFIDLIHIEMLGFLFDINMEIHTTFEVYNQLNEKQKKIVLNFVQSKSLHVYKFTIEEITIIASLEFPRGLEFADRTVYYYSSKINSLVLSGDRKLKTFCESKSLEVRGILWLFETLVNMNIIHAKLAAQKLKLLISINDRLPIETCEKLILKWENV